MSAKRFRGHFAFWFPKFTKQQASPQDSSALHKKKKKHRRVFIQRLFVLEWKRVLKKRRAVQPIWTLVPFLFRFLSFFLFGDLNKKKCSLKSPLFLPLTPPPCSSTPTHPFLPPFFNIRGTTANNPQTCRFFLEVFDLSPTSEASTFLPRLPPSLYFVHHTNTF